MLYASLPSCPEPGLGPLIFIAPQNETAVDANALKEGAAVLERMLNSFEDPYATQGPPPMRPFSDSFDDLNLPSKPAPSP